MSLKEFDRFIPERSPITTTPPDSENNTHSDILSHYEFMSGMYCGESLGSTSVNEDYNNNLAHALFPARTKTASRRRSILHNLPLDKENGGVGGAFLHPPHHSSIEPMAPFGSLMGVNYARNKARHFQSSSFRIIPLTSERILDAPDLLDDLPF